MAEREREVVGCQARVQRLITFMFTVACLAIDDMMIDLELPY